MAEENEIKKHWKQRALGFTNIGLAFGLALFAGLFFGFLLETRSLAGRVPRGVKLGTLALEGLDRAGLHQKLAPLKRSWAQRQLKVSFEGKSLEGRAEAFGFYFDEEAVIEEALTLRQNHGQLTRFIHFLQSLVRDDEIHTSPQLRAEEFQNALISWQTLLFPESAPPSISFDKELKLHAPQASRRLDLVELKAQLSHAVTEQESESLAAQTHETAPTLSLQAFQRAEKQATELLKGPIKILAPDGSQLGELRPSKLGPALRSVVTEKPPAIHLELDADQLEKSLAPLLQDQLQTAQDATFEVDSRGKVTLVPAVEGIRLHKTLLAQALLSIPERQERKVVIPLIKESPKLSTEEAAQLGIKGLVSSFVTHHACCQPRVNNIHTVADKINGQIVRAGEEFSLNRFLGPRIGSHEYEAAPTIVHGEMKETTGGGISQFATTFFNALLDGGYQIIQRQPHSFYFSRYPEGHEATISFPVPDLIFKNDTKSALLIKTQYSGTFIKVSLYGDNEGRKVTRSKSKRYDIVKPSTEYEADPEMDPEKSKRLRAGQLGWTILVSRKIRFADGHETKEEREVVYKPRPELVRVHPCKIPEGEPGHTGDDCPEPEREEREEELSDEYFYFGAGEPAEEGE